MFDIKKRKAEKLKIIEILLIIGGIIGGIRASGTDSTIFGLFLCSSLFYYFLVSHFEYEINKPPVSVFLLLSAITAISFSILLIQIFTIPYLSATIIIIAVAAQAIFVNLYW